MTHADGSPSQKLCTLAFPYLQPRPIQASRRILHAHMCALSLRPPSRLGRSVNETREVAIASVQRSHSSLSISTSHRACVQLHNKYIVCDATGVALRALRLERRGFVALCSLARQTQTRNRTPVTPRRFFSARSVLPHCTQPAAMFSVGEACARPAAQPTMRTNGKSPLLARPTKDLLKDLPSGRERAGRRASATD